MTMAAAHSCARHPAGSLNPASMRSRSRFRPTLCRATSQKPTDSQNAALVIHGRSVWGSRPMLTKMTDTDWGIVVAAFRAARSRRGEKGRDDRKFLEALHHFSVHNITWRALPAEFGKWNSVWKRVLRLRQGGVVAH